MNARFRLPIVALCIAGMLAGCGSVTQGITFQPPAGWTGTPAMFGKVQIWMKAASQKGDTPQMLWLIKESADKKGGDFSNIPPQYAANLKVLKRGDTKLCDGKQPAKQFIAEGTDKNGRHSQVEMMTDVIGDTRYMAMYIHAKDVSADPQAETAIHSLCATK